jgi:hypothetical protein
MRTVIALLSDLDEALQTARDLKQLGLRSDQISVVSPEGGGSTANGDIMLAPVDIAELGEVLAGGPMTSFLDAGALVSALLRMGLSQPEAFRYVELIRNGGTLEAAVVDDAEAPRALQIMREHAHERAMEKALRVAKRVIPCRGVRVSTHVIEPRVAKSMRN